jgi:hypothetical protein
MHKVMTILLLIFIIILYVFLKPRKNKINIIKELTTLKTQTVNLLNKTLKIDTSKLVDFHIPDVHCEGIIDHIMSPDELFKLSSTNPNLYKKLIECNYTKTVGLLHGFVLWTNLSKTKDMKSFQYFIDCVNKIVWSDPTLFNNFHSTKSKIGICIV